MISRSAASSFVPPSEWRAKKISYQKLCELHPTKNGIYVVDKILISVQMLLPNTMNYKDGWFQNDELRYLQSKSDKIGNDALKKAFEEKISFKAFCRYKKNEEEALQLLNVPSHFFNTNHDLGKVYIDRVENECYVLKKK
jgi:hypothetical protein